MTLVFGSKFERALPVKVLDDLTLSDLSLLIPASLVIVPNSEWSAMLELNIGLTFRAKF